VRDTSDLHLLDRTRLVSRLASRTLELRAIVDWNNERRVECSVSFVNLQ